MKILWLNAGLLLPLDKGGKLRTWHLMRHLARRHDITYLSFADPAQTAADREGMREVCRRLETVPRTDAAKGTLRFYADAARYLVDPLPYAVAKYRSAAYAARSVELLERGGVRRRRLRLPSAGANLPATLPRAVGPVHAQRRGGDLAAARRDRRQSGQARAADRSSGGACCASSAKRWRGSTSCSPCQRPTATRSSGSIRGALRHARPRRADRRRYGVLHADAWARTPRPPRLHRIDGLAAERGRHAVLRPRHPAAHPRSRARRRRSASSAARRRRPCGGWRSRPASKSPGASTTSGRTSRPATVYVVPLRIGGGTRLKIFEAMSMAKAVVSTTIGAEGLPVTAGTDIVHRRRPASVRAQRSSALLRDAERSAADRSGGAPAGRRALRLVGRRQRFRGRARSTAARRSAGRHDVSVQRVSAVHQRTS